MPKYKYQIKFQYTGGPLAGKPRVHNITSDQEPPVSRSLEIDDPTQTSPLRITNENIGEYPTLQKIVTSYHKHFYQQVEAEFVEATWLGENTASKSSGCGCKKRI